MPVSLARAGDAAGRERIVMFFSSLGQKGDCGKLEVVPLASMTHENVPLLSQIAFDEKDLRREISHAIKNVHGVRQVGPQTRVAYSTPTCFCLRFKVDCSESCCLLDVMFLFLTFPHCSSVPLSPRSDLSAEGSFIWSFRVPPLIFVAFTGSPRWA